MHEAIGHGSYGKVRRCTISDGTVFAAKIVNKSILKRKRVGRFGTALDTVGNAPISIANEFERCCRVSLVFG